MNLQVSLRPVQTGDLPHFFEHQLDPEATRLAAFPSRDRDAFLSHWTNNIIGNPTALSRTILLGDQVVGNIGAWTDSDLDERLVCYWIGRDFWNRGIASRALSLLLSLETTRPLNARVAKHNYGSIRVLEKAGFKRIAEDVFTLPDGTRVEEFVYILSAPPANQPNRQVREGGQ